jgi:hypothetical protein
MSTRRSRVDLTYSTVSVSVFAREPAPRGESNMNSEQE